MNNSDQPPSGPISKSPERLHDTAGMMLRKARESANLSQAIVGEALHLTVHYIKALENDDYSKLPGATFVKGYLRVYARYLKLDVNAVLASYETNNANAEELSNRTELSSRNQRRHDQTFKWAVVTAIIVVLGVAAGWWFVGKDQTAASAATATTLQEPSLQQSDRTAPVLANQVAQPADTSAGFRSTLVNEPLVTAIVPDQDDLANQVSAQDPLLSMASSDGASDSAPAVTNSSADIPSHSSAASDAVPAVASGVAVTDDLTSSAIVEAQGVANVPASTLSASLASTMASTTSVAIPGQHDTSLTMTSNATGARQITLTSAGSDLLQFILKGSSWIEIDDDVKGRLYNDTLNAGDVMTLRGTAPFKVLLGDATQVELSFNSKPIDLSSQVRSDKTARFALDIANPAANIATSTQGANP